MLLSLLKQNSLMQMQEYNVSICEGESTILTASGGTTYEWNTGETTASIEVSPSTTTTYTVTAFNTLGTSSDTDDVTVTINSIPVANAGNDVEICQGSSATLTASGGSKLFMEYRRNNVSKYNC